MKMKIKLDPRLAKAGGALIGMAFTYLGSKITDVIQQKEQREAMMEIARQIVKEELKNSGKGV